MDKDIDDVDKHVEWLVSEQYSAAGNIFSEPQKTTRVGDEYQAQIPSFSTDDQKFQNQFEFNLPIPITWVQNYHKIKEETTNIQESDILPLPCSSFLESWSTTEQDSFVLGLYVFGKNLRVVSKFMGNKGIPSVMSYYYGKFYRTKEHQKWSTYRKTRTSKSVLGRKIFNGWRLHELLSRLLPNVTDECKARLTRVTKTYEDGKLSFEKYVLTLRDAAGVDLLVKAVAIGKGKQDLTGKMRNRLRSKKPESTCGSLKTEEIVNILKDRIGLSKSGLNEFFWAAVWPRLLARGWHSEQPRNYACQNSKNLVFLAPGVTKFSRRSLVKGSQYFDSLTEVLNKVTSEPHLLEREPDQDKLVEPHASHGSDDEEDLMKCIVVDTSLVGPVKVKEVSSLDLLEPAVKQESNRISGETERDTTADSCTKMDLGADGRPVRQLKFVFKRNTKRQRVDNEDEAMKPTRILKDLNNPQVGPGSESVLSDTTANPTDSLTPHGQRQSRRTRALTTKALEALANGYLNPKKKRTWPEDGTRRRVRAKTARVSSCGARYLGDRVFDGSSCPVTKSPSNSLVFEV